MRKHVCALALLLVGLGAAGAKEVDRNELQGAGGSAVQFENYSGPHAVIETAAAITGIGSSLGEAVALSLTTATTVQPYAKYSLIHAVSDEEDGKLDADILLINSTATVDHIRNLRRIVTGYLQAAYGYERSDADTIATFITVYNAVYRGQMDTFSEKYKQNVMQYLEPDKAGLSTNWQDWAGKTQIVIPISDLTGGISAVDTSVISDSNVIESLRQEEDKGIEARASLTELKEREAEDATAKAQEAQKAATEQRAEAKAAATPEEKAEARANAEAAANVSATEQQRADKKNMEAQTEREEISKDKTELVRQQAEANNAHYITGLQSTGTQSAYSLVTLDGDTGRLIRRSPVQQIIDKTVYTLSNVSITPEDGIPVTYPSVYLTLCSVRDSKGSAKLCLIDPNTLEILAESAELLTADTSVLQVNNDFYAVIRDGSGTNVGSFDKNLRLTRKSTVTVKADTPLTLTGRGILVTDNAGNPQLLSTADLSAVWGM